MSLLGIDVGTTGCKAAAFTSEGRVLSAAYREYAAGGAELDASEVWILIRDCIREAVGGTAADPVTALSVSSLGEAVVPVTADRRILGPSILNFDPRGREYVEGLRAAIPDNELYAFNGNTHGNHYGLTKLMWIRDNAPALYEQTDHFLLWSGFVSFMLGAEACVDYSLANRTLCFDLAECGWSARMRSATGLDFGKLPRPVPSGTVIGRVSREAAVETGLPEGTAIVAGAHDQCANAIGCGVVDEGSAMYGMGTFTCIVPVFVSRPDPSKMTPLGLNTEHHAAPGRFVSFIYNQGGSLLKWYRDTFAAREHAEDRGTPGSLPLGGRVQPRSRRGRIRLGGKEGVNAGHEAPTEVQRGSSDPQTANRQRQTGLAPDLYDRLLAEMPDGPSGIVVLPHFTTTGPPEFIDDSCGIIAGLHLDTSRGRILKGVLEGTTFYLREITDALPAAGLNIAEYTAVGGGAKSAAWVQLSADIMGVPFRVPEVTEAGALGAALIAGVGTGVYESYGDAVSAAVRISQAFEPDAAAHERYGPLYAHYRSTAPLMRDYLRDLAGLQ
jgi:xylulokinase